MSYSSIWMALAEQEFTQSWQDINGVRTRVLTAGDSSAQAVVLLHGTGGHWETFAPTLSALSDRYFVVAFDMIGNGFSEKPDYPYEIPVYIEHVRGVMGAQGIAHAHFVGMSLGAWVAAAIAQRHPELVDKLVLMSPAGLIATQSNMARIRAERTKAVENPTWESIKAMFNNLIADEARRLPDLIGLRQAIYCRKDTLETIDHLLALQDAETRERNLLSPEQWGEIKAPTMVVASGQDHGEYQSTAQQVARLIANSTMFEMPSVRHWPHFEDPESFNPALVEFLGREN